MKLYSGAESGNSWKIRILLEQFGVPYEKVLVDMDNDEHKSERFRLQVNPRGQVPVLEDEGRRYWDSAAALVYIARKLDRQDWLPIDAAGMAEVMQWVAMSGTEIQFGLQYTRRGVMRGRWLLGPKESLQDIGRIALDAMQWRLNDHDWLALDRITIADVACFPYVYQADEADLPLGPWPAVDAWVARCMAQPNWARPPQELTRPG